MDKLAHRTFPKNKVRSFCLCFSRSQLISVFGTSWVGCLRFGEIMPSCQYESTVTVTAHVEETLDHGVICSSLLLLMAEIWLTTWDGAETL